MVRFVFATNVDAPHSPEVHLDSLEERVLYSAAPISAEMVGLDSPDQLVQDASEELFATIGHQIGTLESMLLPAAEFSYDFDPINIDGNALQTSWQEIELLIVDQSVEDHQLLVQDVLERTVDGRHFEIRYLDSNRDGIEQVSNIIADFSNIKALHLVTHGADGQIQIGNTVLHLNNLNQHLSAFELWQGHLADGSDLLLYGCDVAQSSSGIDFVDRLAEATGLDIAASSDVTGAAVKGGDWDFEYQAGTLESTVAFSIEIQQQWEGTLPAVAVDVNLEQDTSADGRGNKQAIAMAANGDHVIVWSERGTDGDDWGVFFQLYDATGAKVGAKTQVNEVTKDIQQWASVGMDASGNFVVTWTNDEDKDVSYRSYDASGTALLGEQTLNTNAVSGRAEDATIAMNANGEFVIAWVGHGHGTARDIFMTRFAANGTKVVSDVLVNTTDVGNQLSPDVSINASGDFIVSWHDNDGIYIQRYNADGSTNGSENRTHDNVTLGNFVYDYASVALQDDGRFAVLGHLTSNIGTDGFVLRLYEADGSFDRIAGSTQTIDGPQFDGSIQVGADGTYLITWEGEGSRSGEEDDDGVFARLIDANGDAISDEFRVNAETTGSQNNVSSAILDQNNYAFVYAGASTADLEGIYTRVATVASNTPPTAQDVSIGITEDQPYLLDSADMGFSDVEGNLFQSIIIDTIPNGGQLIYNGQIVGIGEEIDVTDIDNQLLQYIPPTDASGSDVDGFDFRVFDGLRFSEVSYRYSFNISGTVDPLASDVGESLSSLDGASFVNTTQIGDQTNQQIASLAGGGYVVVWDSTDGDLSDGDSGRQVFLQQYDANGQLFGAERRVDTELSGTQYSPSVTGLADGGFVITWTQDNGTSTDVYAQRFLADGSFTGISGTGPMSNSQVIVSQNSAANQFGSTIIATDNGGFAIAWSSADAPGDPDTGTVMRTFTHDGLGSTEFTLNTTVAGVQRDVEIAALENGRYAAAWVDQTVNSYDVKIRLVDPRDPSTTVEFTAHNTTTARQSNVSVTVLDSDTVLVAWESNGDLDGAGKGVFGRRFDFAGNPIDAQEFQINESINGHQQNLTVLAQGQGSFYAFWESARADRDGFGIQGIRYDSNLATSGEFVVNTHQFGDQNAPAATILASGEIVVTWQAADGDNQNGEWGRGIFHDRFIPAVNGLEDTPIPLNLDWAGGDFDGSESLTQLEVRGLPSGVTLSDGTNTQFNQTNVDITTWNHSQITLTGATDSYGSFQVTLFFEVADGAASQTFQRDIQINIVSQDDLVSVSDLSTSVNEDSTTHVSVTDLQGAIDDVDDPVGPNTVTPANAYRLDASTPLAVSGSDLVWTGTSGLDILLDVGGVSFVANPTTAFPGIDAALAFNGLNGGQSQAAVNFTAGNGGVDLWFKPDNLTQTGTLFEFGDNTFGLGIYQNGDQVEAHFYDRETIDGNNSEPFVLVADLIADEFNQVSFAFDFAGSAGDQSTPDLHLFANGQRVGTLADIPMNWSGASAINVGQPNGFSYAGGTTYGNFVGQIARVDVLGTALTAEEVAQIYNEVTYQAPELLTINGTTVIAGQTYTLASGAEVTYNVNGSLTYDTNGQFQSLALSETIVDTIPLQYQDESGIANSSIDVTVQGQNDAPTVGDYSRSIPESTALNTVVATVAGADVDQGASLTYSIVSGNVGSAFAIDSATGEISINNVLDFETTSSYSLGVEVTDEHGESATSDVAITVTDSIEGSISGRIIEDVVGDGDISSDPGVAGVNVILYRDNGNSLRDSSAVDTVVGSTLTDADGRYEFLNVQSGDYYVVVDSTTISPTAGLNNASGQPYVWAEQTYGSAGSVTGTNDIGSTAGTLFGGANAELSDDASTLATSEHLNFVSIANANVENIDFGFSFNVVTNLLGGNSDDHSIDPRTIQGSLRQFIQNGNEISGGNEMRFVPVVNANHSTATGDWFRLDITAALPSITDDQTRIDGRVYSSTDGSSILSTNSSTLGTRGSIVGVGDDGMPGTGDEFLRQFNSPPELEIVGDNVLNGIVIEASNVTVRDIAIHGFGLQADSGNQILIDGSTNQADNVTIRRNVIGASADRFSNPDVGSNKDFSGIRVIDADHGRIANNLIGFASRSGIEIAGTTQTVEGWTITRNEIRGNGTLFPNRDGINLVTTQDIEVSRNYIVDNQGYGIDLWDGAGQFQITGNTIEGNGQGGLETGGIRLFGNDSVVQHNYLTGNTGSGVHVVGVNSVGGYTSTAAIGNLISQNSFDGNSGNAIDLSAPAPGNTTLRQGDGISLNSDANNVNAGNNGLDYAVLGSANWYGTFLQVSGFLSTSDNITEIEFYVSQAATGDSNGGDAYGEGQHYLGTMTVADIRFSATTGAFSGFLTPTTGWPASIEATTITSLVIDSDNNTSEFSGNIDVNTAPTAIDSPISMLEDATHVFDESDFPFTDDQTTFESVRIKSLPINGTFELRGVAVTLDQNVTRTDIVAGELIYRPAANSFGSGFDSIDFQIFDGQTLSVNTATLTIDVVSVDDAPNVQLDEYKVDEDSRLDVMQVADGLLANDLDLDGDVLTVNTTPVSGPTNGNLYLNADGTFIYRPNANFFGIDQFEYAVTDGTSTVTGLVQITVNPVNDAPILTGPTAVTLDENSRVVADYSVSDIDSTDWEYSIVGSAPDNHLFQIDRNTGELSFIDSPNFESPTDANGDNLYVVRVGVMDAEGEMTAETIRVSITDLPDQPVASNDTFSLDEGASFDSVATALVANDVDGFGSRPDRSAGPGPRIRSAGSQE